MPDLHKRCLMLPVVAKNTVDFAANSLYIVW